MLQEGLEHDHNAIKQQLDNRKLIHEPMTIVIKTTIA